MTAEIGQRVRARIQEKFPGSKQEEIAESIGMTPDAFSRALNGRRGFAAVELAAISQLLQSSMYWLTTGARDPQEPRLVARHSYDHLTGTRWADWDGIGDVVSNVRLAYSQVRLPEASTLTIPRAADEVRELLGNGFIAEFADRVESRAGIDIVRVAGIETALALVMEQRPIIMLGETGNWFYQNWSLAHELGHFALGHVGTDLGDVTETTETDRQEFEANAFAAELLLPVDEMMAVDWDAMSPAELAYRLWEWGVSTSTLANRLDTLNIKPTIEIGGLLGLKTQTVLRRYWTGNDGLDDLITTRMDRAAVRRFPVALLAAHVDAIGAGTAPKATLAWMLGVAESEVEVDEPPAESEGDLEKLARELGLPIPS
ncbi:helix-turn-helix domain-containing protein [Diaminobutyricibacter sp. McL0618]|uniref:helix-turn-helix domain-containing protein n=1 Tax=Leifsonia sp. McL0618 TaxID=3415677 RepID=UPI003CF246E1